MTRLVLCLLALTLCACEARSPAREALEVVEPPMVQLAPSPVNKAPDRMRPTPDGLDPRAATALAGVLTVATEMKEAAIAAEAAEEDLCVKAFLATTAAARVGREAHENGRLPRRPPELVIAPRARFLALCSGLPDEAKRCASFAHRVENTIPCRQTRDALSDGQRRALDEMSHQR